MFGRIVQNRVQYYVPVNSDYQCCYAYVLAPTVFEDATPVQFDIVEHHHPLQQPLQNSEWREAANVRLASLVPYRDQNGFTHYRYEEVTP